MRYVIGFAAVSSADIQLVGGKNASLGEMIRNLTAQGLRVPGGFAVTTETFRSFLAANQLESRIQDRLAGLNVDDFRALRQASEQIRGWILASAMPTEAADAIARAYRVLAREYGDDPDVAVRSSATAEDLPNASFAGQQDTFLNVRGVYQVLEACIKVFASLYNERAISYRHSHGFSQDRVAISVGVQKMVRADCGASGVMFTLDTESGFRDATLITGSYGLGEEIVQGTVNPDEWLVFKPALKMGFAPIVRRRLGEKRHRLVYAEEAGDACATTKRVEVGEAERKRFCLSDAEVLELARQATMIEAHYGRPMDIEWAKDGETQQIYILQARPETVQTRIDPLKRQRYYLKETAAVLCEGVSVGSKVGQGTVKVVLDASMLERVEPGDILVTDITDPDWEPAMRIASAIVTNRGGRTCHAAIVARELGVPAVVGCKDATERLTDGREVTVSCCEGDRGFIYDGILEYGVEESNVANLPTPRTKLMLNLANPSLAFEAAALPVAGVGLARLEFIINNTIGIHPRAILDASQQEASVRAAIEERARGYGGPVEFYISRLAEGIATIAAAFYPRPVTVRFSDFKSNEYAALLGGNLYEPREENPMLGYRGASRYYHPDFERCFAMECQAISRVRDQMGLRNVHVMLPFVRTLGEAEKVHKVLLKNGLKRGRGGLNVYLMCEIPANVILADRFLELFDGFSIGSNDLTQLTLGVDRDSSLDPDFNETDDAVLAMLQQAIDACVRRGKYVGICGQAPSDFPELTQWLVEQGIESISLNPDSVLPMLEVVSAAERRRERRMPVLKMAGQ